MIWFSNPSSDYIQINWNMDDKLLLPMCLLKHNSHLWRYGKNLSVNKQIDKSIYSVCWDTQPSQKKKHPLSMICRWRRTKRPHTKTMLLGLACKREIKESKNMGAESGMWEIRRCGVTGINYNCIECIMGLNYAALSKAKQGKMKSHFSMMHNRPWEVGGRLPLWETFFALLRASQHSHWWQWTPRWGKGVQHWTNNEMYA